MSVQVYRTILLCATTISATAILNGLDHAAALSTESFLVPSCYGGVTNQLFSVYHALLISLALNATLVLPHWQLARSNQLFLNPLSVPFSFIYSLDTHVLLEPPLSGRLQFASDIPHDKIGVCLSQLSSRNTERYTSLHFMHTALKLTGIACLDMHSTYYELRDILSRNYDTTKYTNVIYAVEEVAQFRRAMIFNTRFTDISNFIITKMTEEFGTDHFYSLHDRSEGDMVYACSVWPRRPWRDETENRACLQGDDEMYDSLVEHNVSDGSVLLIMGAQLNVTRLPKVCGGKGTVTFRCTTKANYWTKVEAESTSFPYTLNSRALVDFVLASRAQKVFGHAYSTMSIEMFFRANAQMGNGTGIIYNKLCSSYKNNQKCP